MQQNNKYHSTPPHPPLHLQMCKIIVLADIGSNICWGSTSIKKNRQWRRKLTPTCSPLLPLSPDSSLKVLLRASPPPPRFLFLGSRALALRLKSPPESLELSLSTLQLNHCLISLWGKYLSITRGFGVTLSSLESTGGRGSE